MFQWRDVGRSDATGEQGDGRRKPLRVCRTEGIILHNDDKKESTLAGTLHLL